MNVRLFLELSQRLQTTLAVPTTGHFGGGGGRRECCFWKFQKLKHRKEVQNYQEMKGKKHWDTYPSYKHVRVLYYI
jgi:hypothetical protein